MKRPKLVSAIAAFFVFGACMSALTAFLLTFPGTPLDAIWRLNPEARTSFVSIGSLAVLLMLVVCAACTTAAVGLFRLRKWGLVTAIIVLVTNTIGDTLNAFLRHDYRALIGLPIAGLMIAYLWSKSTNFD